MVDSLNTNAPVNRENAAISVTPFEELPQKEQNACEELCQQSFANGTPSPIFCNPLFNPKLQPHCEPTVTGFNHEIERLTNIECDTIRSETIVRLTEAVTHAGLDEAAMANFITSLIKETIKCNARADGTMIGIANAIINAGLEGNTMAGLFDRLITAAKKSNDEGYLHEVLICISFAVSFGELAEAVNVELFNKLILASKEIKNDLWLYRNLLNNFAEDITSARLTKKSAANLLDKLITDASETIDIGGADLPSVLNHIASAVVDAGLKGNVAVGLFNKLISATKDIKHKDYKYIVTTLDSIGRAIARTGLEEKDTTALLNKIIGLNKFGDEVFGSILKNVTYAVYQSDLSDDAKEKWHKKLIAKAEKIKDVDLRDHTLQEISNNVTFATSCD